MSFDCNAPNRSAGFAVVHPWILSALLAGSAHAALNLEIVNDSGRPDNEVFAVMMGNKVSSSKPIQVTGIPATDQSTMVTSVALSALPLAGYQVQSQFSGRALPVHSAAIGSIASGVLLVSYGQALNIENANPSPVTSNFRFDQCEVTFDPDIESVANLTSIDSFAIPLQFELFTGVAPALSKIGSRTYYLSSTTLLERFQSMGVSSAFRGIAPGPGSQPVNWQPADGMASFARILGPNQMSAASPTGSPSPYPSFGGYLGSLVGQQFEVSGTANASTYQYTATVVSDGQGGYSIQLAGTTNPAPPVPVPDDANMTINLPSATAPGALDDVNYDFFIYGAPLNGASMSVSGMTPAQIDQNSNIVYGSIARDVLSALNFGYIGGRYGNKGRDWYSLAPTSYPFGGARSSNDGFYNPWAALIYNSSDAYGFAFSDRTGPSPAIKLENHQTLRITILPDERLDSPEVTVAAVEDDSISLSWPAVNGATGYEIRVTSPAPVMNLPVATASGTVSHTISGLQPGVPYSYTVVAVGTANGNPVESPGVPMRTTTTGSMVPVTGGGISFAMAFSYLPPAAYQDGAKVSINGVDLIYRSSGDKQGQWLTDAGFSPPDANAPLNGVSGTNQYVLTVRNDIQGVIFQNIVSVDLSGDSSSYTFGGGTLNGNDRGNALTGGAGPFSNGMPLVTGVPFVPLPTKLAWPVVLPGSGVAYDTWISGFSSLTDPALRAKSADPDGDGMNNLAEFALAGDPTSGAASGKSAAGMNSLSAGPLAFTYTFATRDGVQAAPSDPQGGELVLLQSEEGIIYRIQATTDLQSFDLDVQELTGQDAAAIHATLPDPGAGWTYRTFRAVNVAANPSSVFLRLAVQQP